MDVELFNHAEKCCCCFASFRQPGEAPFRVTPTVRQKFYRLTNIQLQATEDSSNLICKACNSKLSEFSRFQQKMIENQSRLTTFREMMSPVVVLNRIGEESSKGIMEFDDPLGFNEIKIGSPITIKEEINDIGLISFCSWENDALTGTEDQQIVKYEPPLITNELVSVVKETIEPLVTKSNETSSVPVESNETSSFPVKSKTKSKAERNPKQRVESAVPKGRRKCEFCSVTVKSCRYLKHSQTHTLEKFNSPYCCDHCDYKTFTRHHLLRHVKNHTATRKDKRFSCGGCGKPFIRKEHVRRHEKTCGNESGRQRSAPNYYEKEKFRCLMCEKICISAVELRQHRLINHEPKLPCEVCGKWVAQGPSFTFHMKTHTQVLECKHPGCDEVFHSFSHRSYHIRAKHTPQKPLPCSECNITFWTEIRLSEHMRRQHNTIRAECIMPNCKFSTLRKGLLAKHYNKHAGTDEYWRERIRHHMSVVTFHKIKKDTERRRRITTEDLVHEIQ